jgi:hypothetical protein
MEDWLLQLRVAFQDFQSKCSLIFRAELSAKKAGECETSIDELLGELMAQIGTVLDVPFTRLQKASHDLTAAVDLHRENQSARESRVSEN